MIFKFLRGLKSSGGDSGGEQSADSVDYSGFRILPNPQKVSGGWSTQGLIVKEIDGEERSKPFVRSDTLASRDEAIRFSIEKGKRIIDEQGERLFS